MFVSIKWKAVVFLSLVLIAIIAAWVAQHIYKTIHDYESRVTDLQARQQLVLNQLLDENFLHLSQLSQLIAETPRIEQSHRESGESGLNTFLQQEWIKLNINTGIDYIAIYSAQGANLGEAVNPMFFQTPEALSTGIDQLLQINTTLTPQSFVFCDFGCFQFIIEPFVMENGSEAVMVVGQNIADVIQRYKQVSTNDLAVLLDSPSTGISETQTERSLPNWNMRVWAASRFTETLDQLQKAQASYSFDAIQQQNTFDYGTRKLLFNEIELKDHQTLGNHPGFVVISDETQQYNSLVNSVKISLLIGVLALIISEILLIMLMLSPLRRLTAVVEALNLLPKHEYDKAQKKVQGRQIYLQDELTLLEKSTRFVTTELETLHIEVEEKNDSLKTQIAIISRSRAFLERLIDSSHLFIATQQIDGTILTTNTRFETEFNRPFSKFQQFFNSDQDRAEYDSKIALLRTRALDVIQFDAEFVNDQGHIVYSGWTCSLVEDEKGLQIILATGIDLTQRKRDEEALEWLANNDPLTGIGNRRAFQQDLTKVLKTRGSSAIIFIDINRFKQINDLYGHAIGDDVLIQIAQSLKANVRASDAISRLAGDEFTIVLPNIESNQLQIFLTKLSTKLSGKIPIPTENRSIEYSVSIGAALIPEHGTTEQELVVHADMAMYQAKKKGANHWQIFDPADSNLANIRRDHDLTALLKHALSENDLFQLNYQPILSLERNEVSHYEVLLRLKDSSGNPVYPNEFIPAAERMGLIRLVDAWVLEHAIEKLAIEYAQGQRISFSINVSAPSLQAADLPELLQGLVSKYQVAPSSVILELTETAYIENFQMVLTNLNKINDMGIMVALDDFGVGFSSFSYLKKLPLSYVKLDGSYILDLENSPDNQVFVQSLTNMVNAFGMQTIAEFVEDETTLKKLRELGVDYGQGYHIGKPSPYLREKPKAQGSNRQHSGIAGQRKTQTFRRVPTPVSPLLLEAGGIAIFQYPPDLNH